MDEELYEIVPVDPLHKLKTKGSELEKEIDAIKEILRDTITASKINKNADRLVDRLIEMIQVTQGMVESVAKSNQDIGRQLNKSIQEMNESNRRVTEKLEGVMEFFARAAETEAERGPDVTSQLQNFMDKMESRLNDISESHRRLEEKTRELERKSVPRSPVPAPTPAGTQPQPFNRPVSLVPAPPKPFNMDEG